MGLQLVGFAAALLVLGRVAGPLVEAALAIGRRLRLPGSVVGATLGAIATSAPELGTTFASLLGALDPDAAARGVDNIGIAALVGSAAFNLAAVVGAIALITPGRIAPKVLLRDALAYGLALVLLLVVLFVGDDGHAVNRVEAGALLLGYCGYVVWTVRADRQDAAEPAHDEPSHPWLRLGLTVLLVYAAAHVLVEMTAGLAQTASTALGLSVVGVQTPLSLVVVAAATSVPDLMTSLAAARRGETSMAVSNAVGSNTFDLLVGLGIPYATLGTHPVQNGVVLAVVGLVAVLAVLLVLLRRLRMRRRHGVLLIAVYIAFAGAAVATFGASPSWAGRDRDFLGLEP